MFNFLRDLTKSAEEKRQEQITAFVDGELSPRERQRFAQLMADDPGLQAEVAEIQQFKQNLRQLPRRRVPRNFTLDPALYQAPQRQPLLQLYPAMRVATVLTAVFLIIAVSADLLTFGSGRDAATSAAPVVLQFAPAAESAMDTAADEAMEEMAVEAGAVAEETMAYDAAESANVAAEAAAEAPAEDAAPEPQLEVAAASEAEVVEAEEMAEAPPQEPLSTPERTVKGTPIVMDAESNALSEESTPMDDGTGEAAASAELPQTGVAATPSPASTQTPDTPRIQPSPTLTDRGVETQAAATEIAVAPVATIGIAQDKDVETAVSVPHPPASSPISTLRVIQIALAVLLVVLGTAVLYTRRHL